ncbi:MAG: DUF4347 domain-containing protein [Pseudomonadota bacterium]
MIESRRPLSASFPGKKGIQARALEPRVLFDAAAVETAAAVVEAADSPPPVDTAVLFEAPASSRHEAYFIDAAVDGHEGLLAQVPVGAEVFVLDPDQSGIEQINAALAASGRTFDAIHVISHGSAGSVRIGSDVLTNNTISAYQAGLGQLGGYLSSDADILLYGCDVASSSEGAMLMVSMANMTGADVAASTDDTGGPEGNAILEASVGVVAANPWSAVGLLSASLQLDGVDTGEAYGDSGQADQLGYAVDASGDWVVAGGNGNGEVQVFKVTGATRTMTKITGPAGSSLGFGKGVSIAGGTMVIGDPDAGTSGMVFVYQLDAAGTAWSLAASINISTQVASWGTSRIGPWTDANYGSSQWIAVSGNRIAVGAPNEGSNSGRIAWITDTSASGNWSTLTTGFMDEPADYGSAVRFGATVALAGDLLIVGGPSADTGGILDNNQGLVALYSWTGTGGPSTTPSTLLEGGTNDGYFGASVDAEIYGGKIRIVVGAPKENTSGRVYIYEGTSVTSLNATILSGQTTGNAAHRFGLAVAVSQGRVAVGSPGGTALGATTNTTIYYYDPQTANDFPDSSTFTDTGNGLTGGIYRYAWAATTLSSATVNDRFGRAVAIANGNMIVAGAPVWGTNRGAVNFYYARTPVAVNDSAAITETQTTTINILSNDVIGTESPSPVLLDGTNGNSNTKAGEGSWTLNADRTVTYNPGTKYDYLAAGETATVSMQYRLSAALGGQSFSTLGTITITLNGENDPPVVSAGLPNITVPRRNEPVGNPSGASTYSSGSMVIPISAFSDADASNTLTYTLVSTAKLSGDAALPASLAAGVITVSGSYNMGTGANTGSLAYDLGSLTDTRYQNSSWTVTVRATDNAGAVVNTTFTFNIGRDNQNPEIVGTGVPNYTGIAEDAVFTRVLTSFFTDPDPGTGPYAESLTYSLTSQSGPGPDWLALSAAGTLTGVPTNNNVGTHTATARATDVFGNYIEKTFTVAITNTNDAPVLTNEIDRKIAIKGENWSFNVTTGQVAWNGTNQPIDDAGPYFTDVDNSTADGRTPSSGDVITYRAYDAETGAEITGTGGSTTAPWLRFNDTSFTSASTVSNALGSIISIRLDAIDRIGGSTGPVGGTTSTYFDIGVFPRDGAAAISTALPAAAYGARLGFDVAISSDNGRWAVVGQPGAGTGDGQVLIYENTNFGSTTTAPSWTLRDTKTPAAGTDGRFGSAVDISADGRYIVVGAPRDTGGAGAVYFYSNTTQGGAGVPGSWAAVGSKTTAPSGDNNAEDLFGAAVAINENGTFVLVGAPSDDAAGLNAGAAYRFAFGGAPVAGDKRMPTTDGATDSRAGDMYGSAVAYDQNIMVVGAPRDNHSGKTYAGSVYVYSTDNTSSTKLKKTSNVGNSDYFGRSVDVESFASRNSVVVAVGAYGDDTVAKDAGAVYLFRSDTMTTDNTDGDGLLNSLVQPAVDGIITAYDATALDGIGFSVAVDVEGDTASGALRVATGGNINGTSPGYVYAYRFWSGYGWTGQRFQAAADASTTNASNQFGYAVDIAGSRILAGAPNAERSTTQVAGLYYSFGLGVTGSVSAIETSPLSGNYAKLVGSSAPAPVSIANGQDNDSDWVSMLQPVSDWSPGSTQERRLPGSAARPAVETYAAAGEKPGRPSAARASIAEEMLFDLRTLKGKALAKSLQEAGLDMPLGETPQRQAKPQGDKAMPEPAEDVKQPAGSEPAPEKNKQGSGDGIQQGLSSQIEAAQAARTRRAQDLLASLSATA